VYPGENAVTRAEQAAVIMATSGDSITYAELEARSNRLAHLYRAHGLRRLDHVANLMENLLRFFEVNAAGERTGLYYTNINTYLSAEEVAYVVNDSQALIVVTTVAQRDTAAALPALCPNVERWLIIGDNDPPAGFDDYDEAVAPFPTHPVENEELGAAMLYSSGTTGRPKGILRPLPDVHPGAPLPLMAAVEGIFQLRKGMRYLSPAPLYHSAPLGAVSGSVRLGGTCVVMEHFDPVQYLDLVAQYRITRTQLVPTMFSRMLKLPEEIRAAADTSSLEAAVHAAAPCPVQVKEQMIEWWGPIIWEYYGATEANGITLCDTEQWLAHRGTVGKPVLGEVVILDEDGKECPTGEPGTVWFRGATNFEYYNDPEKTAASRDAAGTTSTVGDVGYVDDDGYLYLTDRRTYMIISGGVNIYPQETENLLITHPKVFDAAVLGVPNDDLGEEVKAVVQPMPGVAADAALERELIAFCREHLAHFKCPRTVDFVDELPRLPTGKLYKRLLREKYWAGHTTRIS
jgi:long-chain acyl-CoA synthetase